MTEHSDGSRRQAWQRFFDRVGEAAVIESGRDVVEAVAGLGFVVVSPTTRPVSYTGQTRLWLSENGFPPGRALLCRSSGDHRAAVDVKAGHCRAVGSWLSAFVDDEPESVTTLRCRGVRAHSFGELRGLGVREVRATLTDGTHGEGAPVLGCPDLDVAVTVVRRRTTGAARWHRGWTESVRRPEPGLGLVGARTPKTRRPRCWPSISPAVRGGNRVAAETRIAGGRAGGTQVREHPRSALEWQREIARVVSSFEGASRRPAGGIEVDFELRFDLRATGLALSWLSDAFRTALDAADLADTGGVVMRALFDTADTDVVTIQLQRLPRATGGAVTEGAGCDRAPPTERGVADPAATVTAGTVRPGRGSVELETATGNFTYAFPLSLSGDTISSTEVSEILSPSGNVNRALANAKRKAHQLLGLRVGNQYRYPLFQFDRERKQIRPVAEHANRLMECDLDPWGTLDWWFTENPLIGDRRPVDRLIAHALTEAEVELMVAAEQMGMD
ncbi:hypothetical protein [Rhodococcus sp. 21391]|nr:hypothetical protein [Rhodococcus sp. 21391]